MLNLLLIAWNDFKFMLHAVSATWLFCRAMDILYQCKVVLKIQKFRRMVSYAGFYCFTTLVTYAYTTNTYVAAFFPLQFRNLILVQLISLDCALRLSFLQDKGWDLKGRPVLCLVPCWYWATNWHCKGVETEYTACYQYVSRELL
jgi:hypothetical protein